MINVVRLLITMIHMYVHIFLHCYYIDHYKINLTATQKVNTTSDMKSSHMKSSHMKVFMCQRFSLHCLQQKLSNQCTAQSLPLAHE